jgi:hypothetical protein
MGRKSSITQLDPRIREAVDGAVREGRATIEEIVLLIRSMGGEASKSSVGRYVKNATEQLRRYRDAQEISKVWIGKLSADPESDVGRLLAEMLKNVAFQQISDMGEADGDDKPSTMDLMLVAKALDHLSRSQKADVERILRIRKEFAVKAAEAAAKTATAKGLSASTVEEIKKSILGIV